jgi:hypothetical protein
MMRKHASAPFWPSTCEDEGCSRMPIYHHPWVDAMPERSSASGKASFLLDHVRVTDSLRRLVQGALTSLRVQTKIGPLRQNQPGHHF